MALTYRLLGSSDARAFTNVAREVFDELVDERLVHEFLRDPRHHIAVALDEGCIIGFASAIDYVHPDKAPELWVNEVGVSPGYRRRGIGKRLLALLFNEAARLGCTEAWVLTDRDNAAANALYSAAGSDRGSEQVMHTFPVAKRGREPA